MKTVSINPDTLGLISSIIYLTGNIFLARHRVRGWWLRIVGAIGWIVVGTMIGMNSILLLEIIAIGTAIFGIVNWKNRETI